jgi:peptide/nickel transport system permease protein
MITYLFKRMFAMIPTLVGISLLTFLIVLLAPGDPVATKMGQGTGPAASEGGGNDDPARQADAIKAKKKLLGMMEELRAVVIWDGSAAAASRDWTPKGKYKTVDDMVALDDVGDLPGWVQAFALSPDGSRLYAGLTDGDVIALDAADGETLLAFESHELGVLAIEISPDGGTLVSADGDGILRIHDAETGSARHTANALDRPVRDLAFLPDGTHFVSVCDDGMVRTHNAATGAVERQLSGHNNYVSTVAISADGGRMWTAGYDGEVREWDTETWMELRRFGKVSQPINDIALSADGTLLATACDDQGVRVYSLSDGALNNELEGHYRPATAVAFHPDNRTLFSGGRDETLRTWDLTLDRQTAQAPENTGRVFELLVSDDGAVVWSASESWRKTPAWKQYWSWVSKLAVGDFGRSFTDNKPVIDKIAERLPITLGLNLAAVVLMYLISIPLGVHAAVKRGQAFDNITSAIVFMLWSLPTFFLATVLIMYFSSQRNWDLFPSVGLHATNHRDLSYLAWLWDWGSHLVLPMIVLTYGGFASLSRYARTSLLETIQQDYVRTARAKGLPEHIVIYKHALRNSLIAIVTLVGTLLPAMIGGSVIVEYIFSIRGMGMLAFEAILQRDYPVVMAITTFSALLTLMGVLVSDLLYTVVDPRITHK